MILQEFETSDPLRVTTAMTKPNSAQLLTWKKSTFSIIKPYLLGPFLRINTIYLLQYPLSYTQYLAFKKHMRHKKAQEKKKACQETKQSTEMDSAMSPICELQAGNLK